VPAVNDRPAYSGPMEPARAGARLRPMLAPLPRPLGGRTALASALLQAFTGSHGVIACHSSKPREGSSALFTWRNRLHGTDEASSKRPLSSHVMSRNADHGDGLRCANGFIARLGYRVNVNGASQIPSGGSTPLHIAGQIPAVGAATRYYQGWYRDAAASFCTTSRFNLTNGVAVVWVP